MAVSTTALVLVSSAGLLVACVAGARPRPSPLAMHLEWALSAFARIRLFRPILAGATLRDRILACLGALVGIALTAFVSAVAAGNVTDLLWIVPPMGASAVLLFAVPASPMAQPWPAIGGNVISALIGIAVAHFMPLSALSAGIAVASAIAAMSLLRCLHPPGGAAALVGLFAGASSSYWFPLMPVGVNAVILTASAWVYHRMSGHTYPHAPAAPAAAPKPTQELPWTFSRSDVASALEEMGETFDIDTADLETLLRTIEQRALARSYKQLTCRELMSTGLISVAASAAPEEARAKLVASDVRRLPVLDTDGRIVGAVGLRDLIRPAATVRALMTPAATATPEAHAIDLLGRYAHDRVHAVFVVDEDRKPIGVVTEADWLAVLTRGLE
ncbi:CBS domain containing membrane protein [Ancylobacter novellus DSM 506]|uniref:CBS domain containing membrane protein n=1 Tax=Ancylobacter novellus (strain ATCC 8093 / DSM 506 / JCM 20403 / CCM 1077 / IAM 12100 / NBRC 12443 / NCIMB 10456) TaxID=639283 RepID=D7A324_ANCN5|nr:CBS domain containing membrane protein [Ancylobacter novellus DSM 506]